MKKTNLNKLKEVKFTIDKNVKFNKIPCCPICKKPMENAYDSAQGCISPYLWKTTCKHSKNIIMARG